MKLDRTLVHVRAHPEIAPMYERPVRRLVTGSTGLGLFYSVEPRDIIVHALLRLTQNPARRSLHRIDDM